MKTYRLPAFGRSKLPLDVTSWLFSAEVLVAETVRGGQHVLRADQHAAAELLRVSRMRSLVHDGRNIFLRARRGRFDNQEEMIEHL